MARKRDRVDIACEDWIRVRRQIERGDFGEAHEWLGAVRCAIGERPDLHAGARSEGRVVQHFPEVFRGDTLAVARAYHRMSLTLRESLLVHYGLKGRVKVKIERMGIGPRVYWDRIARLKTYVQAWLDHDDDDAERAA